MTPDERRQVESRLAAGWGWIDFGLGLLLGAYLMLGALTFAEVWLGV